CSLGFLRGVADAGIAKVAAKRTTHNTPSLLSTTSTLPNINFPPLWFGRRDVNKNLGTVMLSERRCYVTSFHSSTHLGDATEQKKGRDQMISPVIEKKIGDVAD